LLILNSNSFEYSWYKINISILTFLFHYLLQDNEYLDFFSSVVKLISEYVSRIHKSFFDFSLIISVYFWFVVCLFRLVRNNMISFLGPFFLQTPHQSLKKERAVKAVDLNRLVWNLSTPSLTRLLCNSCSYSPGLFTIVVCLYVCICIFALARRLLLQMINYINDDCLRIVDRRVLPLNVDITVKEYHTHTEPHIVLEIVIQTKQIDESLKMTFSIVLIRPG
jgi:hypothetical protein